MQTVAVNLYFDKNLNVFISPILHKESGVGIAAHEVIELEKGYSNKQLAESILRGLEISKQNDINNQKESNFWKEKTKRGFGAFSKKYKSITVHYLTTKDEYSVTAEKRYKDGSYGLDVEDLATRELVFPGRPEVETIADQVLQALQICMGKTK